MKRDASGEKKKETCIVSPFTASPFVFSRFSFDQRHGVGAEDNKLQFGSHKSGFAKQTLAPIRLCLFRACDGSVSVC